MSRRIVRIVADTKVLVTRDDEPVQRKAVKRVLLKAGSVARLLSALRQLASVPSKAYNLGSDDETVRAIVSLIGADNVAVDAAVVEAGLAVIASGGEFVDGVTAHMGKWLGGEIFAGFDRKAVDPIEALSRAATISR